MVAPHNELAFDLEAAKRAAQRWQTHKKAREQKVNAAERGDYILAEPAERLVKRVNHLRAYAKALDGHNLGNMPLALGNLAEHEAFTEKDISNSLLERVLGTTRDFLGVNFLEKALYVNRSVGRVVVSLDGNRKSFGTGFLVSPRLLLTNHHVLSSRARAQASVAEFDFQLDRTGQPLTVERFALEPDSFFLSDKELDFALTAVRGVSERGVKLSRYGCLPLIGQEGKISIGEPINIIQHPAGEMKQIVLRQNRLLDLPDKFAHYEADTEPGSSGSPVFNDQWEVIALHHSGIPKVDEAGNPLTTEGTVWHRGDDPARLAWVSNEGIRVSRLVAFVEQATPVGDVELRDELLEIGHTRVAHNSAATENAAAKIGLSEELTNTQGHVEFTLPLHVIVRLGAVATAPTTVLIRSGPPSCD